MQPCSCMPIAHTYTYFTSNMHVHMKLSSRYYSHYALFKKKSKPCKTRICVGVFTAAEVSVSVYLNDEPILLLQPYTASLSTTTTTTNAPINAKGGLPQRTPVIMKPIER